MTSDFFFLHILHAIIITDHRVKVTRDFTLLGLYIGILQQLNVVLNRRNTLTFNFPVSQNLSLKQIVQQTKDNLWGNTWKKNTYKCLGLEFLISAIIPSNWASQMAQSSRIHLTMQQPQEMQVWSLGWEDPPEEETVTQSCILAWEIPWTEESDGLQTMGSRKVRHQWAHIEHKHSLLTTTERRALTNYRALAQQGK